MKIDKFGNYIPFPGVTIIAPVLSGDALFWQNLHSRLMACTHLSSYFTLLPSTSYHMTTNNLFTQFSVGDDNWPEFIDRCLPKLQEIHARLREFAFSSVAKVLSYSNNWAIQLVLELSPDQIKTIKDIAKEFDIAWGIPENFHMTLAYQYKHMNPRMGEIIDLEISAALDDILRMHTHPIIRLQAPKLHIFHDMTAFTPWDASSNPFLLDEIKPSFR